DVRDLRASRRQRDLLDAPAAEGGVQGDELHAALGGEGLERHERRDEPAVLVERDTERVDVVRMDGERRAPGAGAAGGDSAAQRDAEVVDEAASAACRLVKRADGETGKGGGLVEAHPVALRGFPAGLEHG